MIPLKAIHKNTEIPFSVPQSWNEITLRQFLFLKEWDKKNFIKLISILCNIDYDILFNSRDIDIDNKIIPLLQWVKDPVNVKTLSLPKEITIDGKQYPVPEDIKTKTLGQKITLQLFLADAQTNNKDTSDCISYALAIYFQPEITGKDFNDEEAKKIIPLIEDCKMFEAYPVGTFFLTNFLKSLSAKESNSPTNPKWKRFKRALARWRNLEHSGQ